MAPTFRCISERPDLLGESPVWDSDNQLLYWVDSVSRLIRCLDPATGAFSQWETPSMVGSIGLGQGRMLVAALQDGIYLLDLDSGEFSPLLQPQPADPAIRFNDGKMDREGRYLCGSMGVNAEPLGKLWRVDAKRRSATFADGIRIANSLCFSPDGGTMYFSDSLDLAIRAYSYGRGDAPVGEARIFVDTSPWQSGPDGATVDAEGHVWATLIQVGKIARFTPDGKLDRLIDAPVDLPSCVAFGGPDLSTLYVTSIKDSGTGRAISKHPDGGRLFAIDGLGVRGLPEARFAAPAARAL